MLLMKKIFVRRVVWYNLVRLGLASWVKWLIGCLYILSFFLVDCWSTCVHFFWYLIKLFPVPDKKEKNEKNRLIQQAIMSVNCITNIMSSDVNFVVLKDAVQYFE